VVIRGKVQGVFYRQSASDTARALHLTGWVRNRDDGRVEAEVEGSREALEKFVAWCQQGPPSAQVEGVDVSWKPPTGKFRDFQVVR
jgi:acylphosphatase